jgi:hypothetical protein
MTVGAAIGRQSSTSGLPTFLALLAAPVLGMVGFRLGWLAELFLGPHFRTPLARVPQWLWLSALAVIAIAASYKASAPIHAANREAIPRVVIDTARLYKRTASAPAEDVLPASRAYDSLAEINVPVDWRGSSVRFTRRNKFVEVTFLPEESSLLIPTPGIDYTNSIDAIPLELGVNARPVLALLITGRATGRRDLLALVSESRELVYLELLERFWNMRLSSLAVSKRPAGDLLLVGSDPQKLLLYSEVQP